MTFAAPWGLLALLALPAVVALHLYRNRLPEQRVAGLFLFPATAAVSEGGRVRTRLVRSPSLWLECLAALLAALWLAGLTFGALRPRHVVVALDDSASMSAVGTRARAEAALLAIAAELGLEDRVTVICSGRPATVTLGPRARPAQLEDFVAGWSPSQPNHSMQSALELARQLAGAVDDVVCVSDRVPAAPAPDVELVACGQAQPNAAVTSARRLPAAGGERLLVTVVGYGAVDRLQVVARSGGGEVGRAALQLEGDGRPARVELALPEGLGEVEVSLPDDALAVDNVVWSLPQRSRVVSVCDRLSPDARDALELGRVFDAMRGWREVTAPEDAQLVLSSAPARSAPGGLQVRLGRTGGAARGHRSPFVVDRSHPLMAGVALEGVGWQAGGGDLPGAVLVAKGRKALLTEEQGVDGRTVHVDVDGAVGNLVRAPDWPILFANLLDAARRAVPGCVERALRVGERLRFRGAPGAAPAVLRSPAGDWLGAAEDGVIDAEVRAPGVYRVRAASGAPLDEVAVHFVDAAESDLRDAVTTERAAAAAVREVAAARVDPTATRRLLAALLLCALLADWWFLLRRGA